MKFIRLSSVVLISVLTLNSGVAMSRGLDQTHSSTSDSKTESLQIEPLIISNIFFDLRNPVRTIRNGLSREQRRQARERRRQELEVARREATEQQRLEAEQRQKYFESLSPEEKEKYLVEQRARREQADKAAALFIMMLFAGVSGSSGGESDDKVLCNSPRIHRDVLETSRMRRSECLEMGGEVRVN